MLSQFSKNRPKVALVFILAPSTNLLLQEVIGFHISGHKYVKICIIRLIMPLCDIYELPIDDKMCLKWPTKFFL